jgi:hypothetical protein
MQFLELILIQIPNLRMNPVFIFAMSKFRLLSCDCSDFAVIPRKKPRLAPESIHRARLTATQKIQAMKYFEETPGMSYGQLMDWCYQKFEMSKKLSKATVSLWFSEKAGKRSQKDKIKHAIQAETNPFKLASKSFQGAHFPDLEHELFAWV